MTPSLPTDRRRGPTISVSSPEGLPLEFEVATGSERFMAFFSDFLLMCLGFGVVVAILGLGGARDQVLLGLALIALFLIRTFYWVWFEIRSQGFTPGKRWQDIRVVEVRGGTLTAEAILARNLMREAELWLPLMALLAPQALWSSPPGWAPYVASVWLFLLACMPLFNRRRLRAGDLVAGTAVVRVPKAVLLDDMIHADARGISHPARYTFTVEQLDLYGIYELQVLEQLLRHDVIYDEYALGIVAEKIMRKIGWPSSQRTVDTIVFLRDFYAAQRKRLEHRMLMGERREFKRTGRRQRDSEILQRRGGGGPGER